MAVPQASFTEDNYYNLCVQLLLLHNKSSVMTLLLSNTPLSISNLMNDYICNGKFCDDSEKDFLVVPLVKVAEIARILAGWAGHIRDLLAACSEIERAAIVDSEGELLAWTEPPTGYEFTATPEELKRLVNQFEDIDNVPLEGCDLEGIHYIVLVAEEDIIIGKKGSAAFVAVKTNELVLIACYEGGFNWSVIDSMDKLAAYMMKTGH